MTTSPQADTGPISRRNVQVRLLPTAIHDLAERAHRLSLPQKRLSLSDVIRASLAVAANHADEVDKVLIQIRDAR